MQRIGLGLRAVAGGAVTVGVALEAGGPRVVLSTFLATAAEGDRLSLQPYHVAAEMERGPSGEPTPAMVAAVSAGRARQEELAATGLKAIAHQLRAQGAAPTVSALLINRAGWMDDLLSYSLAWPDHPPVAEGLAVREALRVALKKNEIACMEMDEKSLPDRASEALGIISSDLNAKLKMLGAGVGPPWRKEEKLACLAAWLALAAG